MIFAYAYCMIACCVSFGFSTWWSDECHDWGDRIYFGFFSVVFGIAWPVLLVIGFVAFVGFMANRAASHLRTMLWKRL